MEAMSSAEDFDDLDSPGPESIENECRVCRGGHSVEHPLYAPCKCAGSIAFVHQDCLEHWLAHSRKETCELCSSRYHFEPEYAENTPAVLPFHLLVFSLLKILFVEIIPFSLRLLLTVFLWLIAVPLATSWLYRIWVRGNVFSFFQEFEGRLKSEILVKDQITGIILTGIIIVSFVILMSFADFLHFQFLLDPNQRAVALAQHQQRNQAQQPVAAGPQAEAQAAERAAAGEVGENPGDVEDILAANRVLITEHDHEMDKRDERVRVQLPHEDASRGNEFGASNSIRAHVAQGGLRRRLNRIGEMREKDELLRGMMLDRRGMEEKNFEHAKDEDDMPSSHGRFRSKAAEVAANAAERRRDEGLGKSAAGWNVIDRMVDDESLESRLQKLKAEDDANRKLASKQIFEEQDFFSPEGFLTEEYAEEEFALALAGRKPPRVVPKARTSLTFSAPPASSSSPDVDTPPFDDDDLPAWETCSTSSDEGPSKTKKLVAGGGGELVSANANLANDAEDALDDDEEDDDHAEENPGFDDIGGGELPGGGLHHPDLEAQVALDELLGLRGPLIILLRNVVWLLVFNLFYVSLFFSLPYMIGNLLVSRVSQAAWFERFSTTVVPEVVQLTFLKISSFGTTEDATLRVLDFPIVSIGYCSLFVTIFLSDFIISWVYWRSSSGHFLTIVVEVLNVLSSVIKVGILLFVRIFMMPMLLGGSILYVGNTLVQRPLDDWLSFLNHNIVGSFGLSWCVGISYMLTVTLSVLQLREVLHPSFLARLIRPQEAHMDLLFSLMNEPPLLHLRRIVLSLAVYGVLLYLFFSLPITLVRLVIGNTTLSLSFCYFLPQIQIPLELAVGHICFLSILEQKKNAIGQLQHKWFCYMSRYLGLMRFILPMPMKPSKRLPAPPASELVNGLQVRKDDLGIPIVGKPLHRPPPNWDARHVVPNSVKKRWAWGTEPLAELELRVAPRVAPEDWLYKTSLLMLSSWALVVSIVLFCVFVPLFTGRFMFYILLIPDWLWHDPLCFFLGAVWWTTMALYAEKVDAVSIIRRLTTSTLSIQRKTIYRLLVDSVYWQSVQLMVGVLLKIPLVQSFDDITRLSFLTESSCIGGAVSSVLLVFAVSGSLNLLAQRFGIANPLAEWSAALMVSYRNMSASVFAGRLSDEALELDVFEKLLLRPWFNVLLAGLLSVFISSAAVRATHPLFIDYVDLTREESTIMAARMSSALLVLIWTAGASLSPLCAICEVACKAVRDKHFLIGRRLKTHGPAR